MEAVSQDCIADAIIFACEQRDGVDPAVFVDYLFSRAALLFERAEMRELGNERGWWIGGRIRTME